MDLLDGNANVIVITKSLLQVVTYDLDIPNLVDAYRKSKLRFGHLTTSSMDIADNRK